MKKYSTEIKTGLIAIVAIALFIWGYNYLKGNNLLSNQRDFYAVYNKIEGLNNSNPVLINGVKVGIVQEIYFHPDQSGRVVVHMLLDNTDFNIPQNTVAMIMSADIMGSKAIDLVLGDTTVYAQSGDTLQSLIKASFTDEINKTVEPIKARTISLLQEIDSVLIMVRGVFNQETQDNLTQSIENLRKTITNLESTTAEIDTLVGSETNRISAILANIQSISKNIKDNNENITNILSNLSAVSDSIKRSEITSTIANANRVMAETADIMEKINKGEGSMGMLINNDSLYNNLNAATEELDRLFEDMRKNPGEYVHFSIFGRKHRTDEK